ncbi:hypothetical protein AB0M34_18525 [Nocardia sp. NPDC050193]
MTASPISAGDFEAHLTVRGADAAKLEQYAVASGLKFVHIVLDRGRVREQPMLTVRESGAFAAVRDSVAVLRRRLEAEGFPVVRVKIEAAPSATGVPVTDIEAGALGGRYYFEHHIKLLLDSGTEVSGLAGLAVAHGAHLSVNARRRRADGRAERFVTQRCRSVGDPVAAARCADLMAALAAAGHRILSAEREFVVCDSDESLDAGWIEESGEQR